MHENENALPGKASKPTAAWNLIKGIFVGRKLNPQMTLEEWEKMESKKVIKKEYEDQNFYSEEIH